MDIYKTVHNDDTTDTARESDPLVAALAALQPLQYRLVWKGPRIARGVFIGCTPVAWMEGGSITGPEGEYLGYYRRLRDGGGSNGLEQEVILSVKEPVIAPALFTCTRIRLVADEEL